VDAKVRSRYARPMPRRSLSFSMILLASCGAAAAPAVVHEPAPDDAPWAEAVSALVARAGDHPRTYEHVESLTDAAGPRLAGSPGDALAVAWGLRAMTDLGFANVHAEPVTVRVWQRGDESVDVVSPVPHRLAAAALGGSVGTPAEGIEAEVVRAASLEELATLSREQVEGRIVFVDRVMERSRDGHGYGDAIMVRISSASQAAELGALAVLIRSIGTDSARFAHTGVMRYADDVPRIPAAAVSNADADTLARWIAAGTPVRVRIRLGCRDAGEAESANVVGEVVGSDRAEEIVLLGAHLDSWDLGRGAIDDGAGVGIMMEVARQIATAPTPPRRTIRVVLFANEENGGAGSRAYAAAHAEELARHVLAMEADFGDGRGYGVHTPEPIATSPSWARIVRLLEPLGVAYEEGEAEGGADLEAMHEAGGVPLADVMQDGSRYFDIHHTANDVMSEIDRESLDHAMRSVLTVAYAVSLDTDIVRRPADR
jgi:carboxypeptidase Q